MVPYRAPLHDPGALCISGSPGGTPDRVGGSCRGAAGCLFYAHLLLYLACLPPIGIWLWAVGHAKFYRG